MSEDYRKHLYKQVAYRSDSGRPHTLAIEYEPIAYDNIVVHNVWLIHSVGSQRTIKPTEDMLLFISQYFFNDALDKDVNFIKTQLKGIRVREAYTKVI